MPQFNILLCLTCGEKKEKEKEKEKEIGVKLRGIK